MRTVCRLFCIAAAVLLAAPGLSSGKAALWLFPDSDSPRQGGHVVGGEFTLNIENRANGNGDNTAYEVELLVSVNDSALLTQGSLSGGVDASFDAGGLSYGTPSYPCSSREIPRHGMFPADHMTVSLGDIAAGQVVRVDVVITGAEGLEVHFDAFGYGMKSNPHGDRCEDLFNAFGHDVTAIISEEGDGEDECPQIAISKDVDPSQVDIGDEAVYLITVSNEGEGEECTITEVVVTDSLPVVSSDDGDVPAFSLVAVDPAASEEGDGELSWSIDSLAAGEELSFAVTVLFDQEAAQDLLLENTACVAAAELDEPLCATAEVAVGEAVSESDVEGDLAGPGFWCNQIRFTLSEHPAAQLSVEDLEGWLAEIVDTSDVFDELVELPDLVAAQELLCSPGGPTTAEEKLVRHLLTLWLNVISGFADPDLSLDALCFPLPLPEEVDPAMTIGALLLAAEAELVADEADDTTLLLWKDVIDLVNEAWLAGEGGCDEGEETNQVHERKRVLRRLH